MSILGIRYKNKLENKLKYAEFSNKKIGEQIEILREERNKCLLNLSTAGRLREERWYEVPPTIEPFLPKEDLSEANTYKLDCHEENITFSYSWLESLKSKLEAKEELIQLCNNSELNKAVFISTILTSGGFRGRVAVNKAVLKFLI